MHECAWIDEDGYGGIWTSVDGCEYIWKDMHRYGWTWMDVGKCIFQKLQKRKLNGPLVPLSFLFFVIFGMEYLWKIDGMSMKYEQNMHRICVEHWWDIDGICME